MCDVNLGIKHISVCCPTDQINSSWISRCVVIVYRNISQIKKKIFKVNIEIKNCRIALFYPKVLTPGFIIMRLKFKNENITVKLLETN